MDEVIETGQNFIRINRKGEATERLTHIAKAQVGILRGLAIPDDTIDVLEVPSDAVPQHAEIQFEHSSIFFSSVNVKYFKSCGRLYIYAAKLKLFFYVYLNGKCVKKIEYSITVPPPHTPFIAEDMKIGAGKKKRKKHHR